MIKKHTEAIIGVVLIAIVFLSCTGFALLCAYLNPPNPKIEYSITIPQMYNATHFTFEPLDFFAAADLGSYHTFPYIYNSTAPIGSVNCIKVFYYRSYTDEAPTIIGSNITQSISSPQIASSYILLGENTIRFTIANQTGAP